MNLKDKKILLTGGSGFLGKWVYEKLIQRGVLPSNIFVPRSSQYDLRDKEACRICVEDKDVVIHSAGKLGNVAAHQKKPAEFFYDNLTMGVHLMDVALEAGVKKFVIIGSSYIYSEFTQSPLKEKDLWQGSPSETVAPYAWAKKMLLVQAQAYRRQYGFDAIYLIIPNFFGPGYTSSHVIPSLISKIHDAQATGKDFIEVWGSGLVMRDFFYVEDAAEAIVLATEKYDNAQPVNIGSGRGCAIKNLVKILTKLMSFDGKICWNTEKPEGPLKIYLDVSRAYDEFGFLAQTSLEEGLQKTINWFYKSRHLERR